MRDVVIILRGVATTQSENIHRGGERRDVEREKEKYEEEKINRKLLRDLPFDVILFAVRLLPSHAILLQFLKWEMTILHILL